MAKMTNAVPQAVRTVGVASPEKIALYDRIAQFLADDLGVAVDHVKPRSFKVENDEGKMVTRRTGSYGLAFEFGGTLTTLEVVMKNDTASIEDFIVEATTNPNA